MIQKNKYKFLKIKINNKKLNFKNKFKIYQNINKNLKNKIILIKNYNKILMSQKINQKIYQIKMKILKIKSRK